jgi:hypothetical protein
MQLWLKADLDLRMNVYACASTGLSDGFLEVVCNAETLSNIALVKYWVIISFFMGTSMEVFIV